MGAAFAALHAGVVAVGVWAVVREINKNGVVGDFEFLELGQDAAHVVVDVFAHRIGTGDCGIVDALGLIFPPIPLRDLPGSVWRVVGDVAEKRALVVHLDKLNCRICQRIDDKPIRLHHRTVVIEGGVKVIVPVPSTKAKKLIETLPVRVVGVLRAVVPFAECACHVPRAFQQLGDSDLVRPHDFMPACHAVHPGADVVAPREQTGPCWGTNRADKEPIEANALRRDPIVNRRVDQLVAV